MQTLRSSLLIDREKNDSYERIESLALLRSLPPESCRVDLRANLLGTNAWQ